MLLKTHPIYYIFTEEAEVDDVVRVALGDEIIYAFIKWEWFYWLLLFWEYGWTWQESILNEWGII